MPEVTPGEAGSFTLIATALQRELFNRGIAFVTVDECQDVLRASIDCALNVADRASAYLAARQTQAPR
jgi:hypothetical protein